MGTKPEKSGGYERDCPERDLCATMLFRCGWNAKQVCNFLGHSDPAFTLRAYVHLLPEDQPEPSFLAGKMGD